MRDTGPVRTGVVHREGPAIEVCLLGIRTKLTSAFRPSPVSLLNACATATRKQSVSAKARQWREATIARISMSVEKLP